MQAQHQLVAGRVVVVGPGDGHHVVRVVGQAHAEIVSLHLAVARAGGGQRVAAHAPYQPAGRVARFHVRVDGVPELVPAHQLHAVVRLAIHAVGLAPHGVGHARPRHEVALVGAVDEHAGAHRAVGGLRRGGRMLQLDGADAPVAHLHPVQAVVVEHLHARAFHVAVERALGHRRLEHPLLQLAVVAAQAAVEVARQPGDHVLVADVGVAQPARGHAAEVPPRLHEQHRLALHGRRVGRHHPRRRAAVHAHVHLAPRASPARAPRQHEAHGHEGEKDFIQDFHTNKKMFCFNAKIRKDDGKNLPPSSKNAIPGQPHAHLEQHSHAANTPVAFPTHKS